MLGGRLRNLIVGVDTKTSSSSSRLQDLDGKVNRLKGGFDKLNTSMDKFGRWGMLRITMPLLAAGGLMVKTASWAEEMGSKFNVVFGEMAASTEQWATAQSKAIGRSRLDIMDYLSETQNMLVGMGMTREAGADLSKQIVEMGIDLASFNNLAESDALSSMQSALIGNHMAARSLGAVLNENTLALAMQQMGLQGTFQQLDENRKMQVRFRAIVMQSEDAIGDAVRTSGSFANQMRALKGEVKDLSAELGAELLPYATDLVSWLRKGVDWFKELDPETKKVGMNLVIIAGALPIISIYFAAIGRVVAPLVAAFKVLATLSAGLIALWAGGTAFHGLIIEDWVSFFKGGKDTKTGRELQKAQDLFGKLKGSSIFQGLQDGWDWASGYGHPVPAPAMAGAGGGSIYTSAARGGDFAPIVNINVTSTDRPRETAQNIRGELERAFPNLMDDFFRRTARRVGY